MTIADTRTRWLALIVLCLGDLMIVLDVDHRQRRAARRSGTTSGSRRTRSPGS